MATQLKHTDFAFSSALTPRPNIRVAYLAGEAATAVNAAMAEQPAELRESTLEELATGAEGDLLQAWSDAVALADQTAAACATFNTEVMQPMYAAAKLMEEKGIPTATIADFIVPTEREHGALQMDALAAVEALAKVDAPDGWALGLKLKLLAEFEPTRDEEATRALYTALARDASILLPQTPAADPFMRGPLIRWEKAYAEWLEADRVWHAFDDGPFADVNERFSRVRSQWPANYDFSSDPAARAEIDAVGYYENLDECQDLCSAATDARIALYLLPAPNAAALATKLKIISAEEDWTLVRVDEIMSQITTDARRFGRHGAYPQSDSALLRAFAGCRADMKRHLSDVETTQEEDDAADEQVDAFEMVLRTEKAMTLEGVLAKLRIAFQHQQPDRWSDYATADPAHPEFVEGLRLGDQFEQLMWSGISDLARIAGVNLSEQGA